MKIGMSNLCLLFFITIAVCLASAADVNSDHRSCKQLKRCHNFPTRPSTTHPPTTRPPTTRPPTTRPPTTRPPTTRPPTTRPPATRPPTTRPPTTRPPATRPPTTRPPTTRPPTRRPPATRPPTTRPSAISSPSLLENNTTESGILCSSVCPFTASPPQKNDNHTINPENKTSVPATTTLAPCPEIDCAICEAKNEGLVRYPTAPAPFSGSVTVTTQCADNAHTINSTSLNVTCTSNGTWTGLTPHCQCDDGYHKVTVNGTQTCEGETSVSLHDSTDLLTIIPGPASFLVILSFIALTALLVLCRMKLRKQKLRDAGANGDGIYSTPVESNGRKPNCIQKKGSTVSNEAYAMINVSKSSKVSVHPNEVYAVSNLNRRKDCAEGVEVIVTNKAYDVHNVSRCVKVPVLPNEAYAVCEGQGREEPVYELVK